MTAEKVCTKCGGTGKLVVDETTHRMCICLYNRKMQKHLGTELMTARPIIDSPLYQQVFDPEQGNLPTLDLTEKNLFLKSWWVDLRGHLTWAFYCKGPNWYFNIVTDERIRNVYVGNEQYAAKRRSRREEEESNNSLHDLIGDTFNLVIIRLGFLGYKNVAMAGALLEALRIREVTLKPTWIIEEPNSVFAPGHFSYSEELADYVHRRFESIDMVKDPNRVTELRGVDSAAVSMEDDVEDARPARVATEDRPMRAVEPPSKEPEDSGMNMGTLFGTKPKKGGWGKKGGGGGGPV